ncbi:MAG: energy-coupling factor transporter transmembrane protein EcfT, partial [Anaerotardibacter sp.]
MNTVFSFGSYYSGNSPLHRLDPRTKLLGGVVFIIAALCAQSFFALIPFAVFVLLLYVISRIPLGNAMKSLAPLLFIVLLASFLNLFV